MWFGIKYPKQSFWISWWSKFKKYLESPSRTLASLITDIDLFDKKLYGDEIKYKSETEKELVDETNPDEYEDKLFRMKYIDDNPELAGDLNKDDSINHKFSSSGEEVQEEEEDWQEFNKRNQKDQKKHGSRKKKK